MNDQALTDCKQNTDRELWRESEGDYYADSIHVTEGGGIGINHGGYVIVKRLSDWHEDARLAAMARLLMADLERLHHWHHEHATAPNHSGAGGVKANPEQTALVARTAVNRKESQL